MEQPGSFGKTLSAPYTLVVEDDPAQLEATVTFLRLEGIAADGVASLGLAQSWLGAHPVDILVIDLGLPDGDGLQWLSEQSAIKTKGIIITTARGRPQERVLGAKAGVDSYLVKPINLEELAAVVQNLYRRITDPWGRQSWGLDVLGWQLIAPNHARVTLTRNETLVLHTLSTHGGEGASRAALIKGLGSDPNVYDWRRMEILVRRLRAKVERTLEMPMPLRTIHGHGYAFTEPLLVSTVPDNPQGR
jgi:DNA-binding response OmpR family regulator